MIPGRDLSADLAAYGSPLRAAKIEIQKQLGAASFYDFFRMAYPVMDPAPFSDNWHLRVVCGELQRAARREIRRMVICVPPRSSKSLMCSVAFPAWVWTWWPSAKFITASYDFTKLATRQNEQMRDLVQSEWYQERWGDKTKIKRDNSQKTSFFTTAGGQRFACAPGAGVTGWGCDFLLLDDPHNVSSGESEVDREAAKKFWFESMPSRLNDQLTGVRIVIQQRVHADDVAGACIRRGYYHVVLPALYEPDHPQVCPLDPRTEPGEVLDKQRMPREALELLAEEFGGLGSYAAAGQLQQRPSPREGGLFKREWFRIEQALPATIKAWVRAWDFAATLKSLRSPDPDWTVGVLMAIDEDGCLWIVDIVRLRGDPATVEAAVCATATQDNQRVGSHRVRIRIPDDPGQAGKAQVAYYTTKLAGHALVAERETGDKAVRSVPLAAQAKVGNVRLIAGDWNETFIEEMCGFPNAGHDDQVDAATAAFRQLVQTKRGMLDFYKREVEEAERRREEQHSTAERWTEPLPGGGAPGPVAPKPSEAGHTNHSAILEHMSGHSYRV